MAIKGDVVHTVAGAPIENGVVVIEEGKISAIGTAATINIPEGFKVLKAPVVIPGLVDARSTVGMSGILNIAADQDQLERAEPMQPELRALDAYNAHEQLIEWVRSFGVTTVHTGHSPGELISGQTLVAKTVGNTVDDAVIIPQCAVAVDLTQRAQKDGSKSPGTRGKMAAMLRAELIKAREYQDEINRAEKDDESEPPARELRLETLAAVLAGEMPMMVTVNRAQDIATALRLAKEFEFRLWIDSAAEAYLLTDAIRSAGVPVLVHPPMARPVGDLENMTFELAARLHDAGIQVAMQSGFEPYVPKTRVVLFEAGMAAAHGLGFENALRACTLEPAKILGVDERVGSLEIGKDGDVALFDGDPFEYTSHCVGVVIEGNIVSEGN